MTADQQKRVEEIRHGNFNYWRNNNITFLLDLLREQQAELEALRKDRERLEFAMYSIFIVRDVGPQTTRIFDTRGVLDSEIAARAASEPQA